MREATIKRLERAQDLRRLRKCARGGVCQAALDDAEVGAAFEALREKWLERTDLGGLADGDFVTTI